MTRWRHDASLARANPFVGGARLSSTAFLAKSPDQGLRANAGFTIPRLSSTGCGDCIVTEDPLAACSRCHFPLVVLNGDVICSACEYTLTGLLAEVERGRAFAGPLVEGHAAVLRGDGKYLRIRTERDEALAQVEKLRELLRRVAPPTRERSQ